MTHSRANLLSPLPFTPDFYTYHIERHLLLCSDGLTEDVAEDSILSVIAESEDIDTAAAQLIQAANDNGGSDNISVILTGRI